jgi:hypothetical protein
VEEPYACTPITDSAEKADPLLSPWHSKQNAATFPVPPGLAAATSRWQAMHFSSAEDSAGNAAFAVWQTPHCASTGFEGSKPSESFEESGWR